MNRYILEGRDAEKVIQENRIRVNRGDVKFTPLGADTASASDGFGAMDTKDAPVEDIKEPSAPAKKSPRSKS